MLLLLHSFVIAGDYDDAIKGLKRAEDDTSLETTIDGAPRKRKPPRRYMYSEEDDSTSDKENNTRPMKKHFRKGKIRMLSESDESENKSLPQVDSDIVNAIKEDNINMHQGKEKEKIPRKQFLKKHARLTVLQEFESNSDQDDERKQRQMERVRYGQLQKTKKHEKQWKMDNTKQKKHISVAMPSKSHTTTSFSSSSSVLSPIKEIVKNSKTSEVYDISPLNVSIFTSDFVSSKNSFPFPLLN